MTENSRQKGEKRKWLGDDVGRLASWNKSERISKRRPFWQQNVILFYFYANVLSFKNGLGSVNFSTDKVSKSSTLDSVTGEKQRKLATIFYYAHGFLTATILDTCSLSTFKC